MKATELRIGNLVNYRIVDNLDERKEWFEPCVIDAVDLQVIDSDYQPIPLTEEWLLKFGFRKSDNEFFRSRNSELCLHWTVNKNKMIPEYNGKRLVTGYDFKYVHQLQNLYFALTNEELTL